MPSESPQDWLAVFGHPDGLAWVLEHERLAFEASRARDVKRLQAGDRVLLYAARAAFRRSGVIGGVIGVAQATTGVEPLETPLRLARRDFTLGARMAIQLLAPYEEVVEIPPLLDELATFPTYGPKSWMTVLRKPLLRLRPGDADRLLLPLRHLGKTPDLVIDGYLKATTI